MVLSLPTIKYCLLPTEYISNSLKAKSYSLLYSECTIGFSIVSEDLKFVPRVCGWPLVGKNMAFILAIKFPLSLNRSNISPVVFCGSYSEISTVVSSLYGRDYVSICTDVVL